MSVKISHLKRFVYWSHSHRRKFHLTKFSQPCNKCAMSDSSIKCSFLTQTCRSSGVTANSFECLTLTSSSSPIPSSKSNIYCLRGQRFAAGRCDAPSQTSKRQMASSTFFCVAISVTSMHWKSVFANWILSISPGAMDSRKISYSGRKSNDKQISMEFLSAIGTSFGNFTDKE